MAMIDAVKPDEDAWERELEANPVFKASQFQAGRILTEEDVAAIQSLISDIDQRENAEVEAFHRGRLDALHQIGGADLVTAIQMKDEARIAQIVRRAMDKIFPKEQRSKH